MPLGGNKSSQEILFERVIQDHHNLQKRVERLETLEFHKKSWGIGCISFVDYDDTFTALKAVLRVDLPNKVSGIYAYTQATIWWSLKSYDDSGGIIPLYMTVNNLAANYSYAYSFTKGGATTDVGADAQAQFIVGRVVDDQVSAGIIHVPFWTKENWDVRVFGEWICHNDDDEAGSKTERGNWGGYQLSAGPPLRFDFFLPAARRLYGQVYLYGWCPEIADTGVPVDV